LAISAFLAVIAAGFEISDMLVDHFLYFGLHSDFEIFIRRAALGQFDPLSVFFVI